MKSVLGLCYFLLLSANPLPSSFAFQVSTTTIRLRRQEQNAQSQPLYLSDNPIDELDKARRSEKPKGGNPSAAADAPEDGSSSFNAASTDNQSSFESNSGVESTRKKKDSTPTPERKISNLFDMQDPGKLVSQSNPWTKLDPEKLVSNLFGGKVGERGEAWTAISLALVISIFGGGVPLPYINAAMTFLAGPGLMVAGVALILASISDLGTNNLTPFLTPTNKASLVTDGIYSKIRHPIYAGLIALCAGFAVATEDSTRLVLTAVLILLLIVKSDKEEEKLLEKFPQYASYRATTGKFFPGDWSFRE